MRYELQLSPINHHFLHKLIEERKMNIEEVGVGYILELLEQ